MKRTATAAGLALLALSAGTAHAQYYQPSPLKPSVEVFPLDAEKPAELPRLVLTPPPPEIAPEIAPVLKPVFSRLATEQAAEKAAEPAQAPAPEPVALPARRKLLATTNEPPPEPPAPVVAVPEPEPEKEAALPPPAAAPEVPPEAPPETLPETPIEPAEHVEQLAPPPAVPLPSDLTIAFAGNASDIVPEAAAKLGTVAAQLRDLPGTRLQVRAYATGEDGNTSSARRISLSRALSVRSHLMDLGIKPNRIDVRALGPETDRGPLDRVDMVFVR